MTERRRANASANSTLFDFGIKRVAATSRGDDEDRPDEVICEAECDEMSQLESNESCSSCSRVELAVKCVGVCCADSSQSKPNQPRDHVLGRTVKNSGSSEAVCECGLVQPVHLANSLRDTQCTILPYLCASRSS